MSQTLPAHPVINGKDFNAILNIKHYEYMLWTARLAGVGTPVVAVLYSVATGIAARFVSAPVGAFQGVTIISFPFLIAFALLGYKWPLPGGILMLATGIALSFPLQSASGWLGWYKLPYWIFLGMYLISGFLFLVIFYLNRRYGRWD